MRKPVLILFLVTTWAAVSGCVNLAARTPAEDKASAAATSHPPGHPSPGIPSPGIPSIELSGDLLYQILEAEIALERRRPDLAAAGFLELAERTRDPRLAERAAQVAIYIRDDPRALKAARLWLELDPASVEARQMVVVAAIRNGDLDTALAHIEPLLSPAADAPAEAAPQAAFSLIASLLTREQDVQTAFQMMERFIASHDEEPTALFVYAHLALRAGALETAREAVERSLELRPDWPDAIALRVRVLQLAGRAGEALTFLGEAVARHPRDTSLRMIYARLLMDARRYQEAIAEYGELAEQMPGNADVPFTLGLIHLQLNELDEAEAYLRRAEAIGGKHSEVQFYLGWVEESRGDVPAAIGHYSAVVNGEIYLEARIRMAVLIAGQGDLEAARQQLHSLRTQRPVQTKRLYQVEAEILRQAGRNVEAMTVLDAALNELPGDFDLLYARALLAEALDRLDIVERDLRAIIERDPDNVDALNALGYTLADRTDRYQEAYTYIKRALTLSPQNNAILDSMGWVLYRLGNYKEAIRYLRRSLEIKQDHEVAAHLGEVLWVAGEQEAAVDVWKQALERFPGDKLLLDVMRRFGR